MIFAYTELEPLVHPQRDPDLPTTNNMTFDVMGIVLMTLHGPCFLA